LARPSREAAIVAPLYLVSMLLAEFFPKLRVAEPQRPFAGFRYFFVLRREEDVDLVDAELVAVDASCEDSVAAMRRIDEVNRLLEKDPEETALAHG